MYDKRSLKVGIEGTCEVAQSCPTLGDSMDCREYWSGLPSLSPGDLPDPGIEPGSPALQAEALPSEPPGQCIKYYR